MIFAVVLFQVLDASILMMVVIIGGLALFQYFTSDKIALATSGARWSSPSRRPSCTRWSSGSAPWPTCRSRAWRWIPTDMPNAFATGRSPKHSAVAVTEGLWRRLEPREVEGVIAHEPRTSPTATCS